jgi:hypothetical protein
MAASEIYDFVAAVAPDYDEDIGIIPQGSISEESIKGQAIHFGLDGSEERISFNNQSTFFITIQWDILTEADAGTIFDWYNAVAKADGMRRSFLYTFGDGHTYVVKFASVLSRSGSTPSRYGISDVRLRIIGKVPEAPAAWEYSRTASLYYFFRVRTDNLYHLAMYPSSLGADRIIWAKSYAPTTRWPNPGNPYYFNYSDGYTYYQGEWVELYDSYNYYKIGRVIQPVRPPFGGYAY